MNSKYSVIALFCEDIREEKSGTDSIVGILPDNINVPSIPGALTRACVYLRIHLMKGYNPGEIHLKLVSPDNKVHDLGKLESDVLEKAITAAQKNDDPMIGLIARMRFDQFPIPMAGRYSIYATIGDDEVLCGVLKARLMDSTPE